MDTNLELDAKLHALLSGREIDLTENWIIISSTEHPFSRWWNTQVIGEGIYTFVAYSYDKAGVELVVNIFREKGGMLLSTLESYTIQNLYPFNTAEAVLSSAWSPHDARYNKAVCEAAVMALEDERKYNGS